MFYAAPGSCSVDESGARLAADPHDDHEVPGSIRRSGSCIVPWVVRLLLCAAAVTSLMSGESAILCLECVRGRATTGNGALVGPVLVSG